MNGDTTREMRAIGEPHPAETGLPPNETETRIRRWGTRALTTGITIPIALYLATLAAALLADIGVFTSPAGQMFATLGLIALMMLSASLLTLAGIERLTRQPRTLIRRAVSRAEQNAGLGAANAARIDRATEAIETNTRLVAELVVTHADVVKRLAACEQALKDVPRYAQGVIDGTTLRASALGSQDHP